MFNELDGIQLGPIFLSFKILAIVLSLIVAYFTFASFVKRDFSEQSKEILETIQTSLVLFLVVFKFLPVVFHPSYLLTPSKLLIYSGGPYAIEIASVVSGGYFIYQLYKRKWSIKLIDHLAVAGFFYLIVNHLFIKTYGVASPFSMGWSYEGTVFHPLNLYYVVLYSLFLMSIIILFNQQKKGVVAIFIVLAFFFVQAILTPFTV